MPAVMNHRSKAPADKDKALKAALSQVERQYGSGTLMRFNDRPVQAMEAIPTGSISLDHALGIWGVPRGRIIEIYGPESSGKTTLALHIVANCQKMGGVAAYIDAEHAMDPIYTRNLGVNLDEMLISQPDYGEQALDIAETLTRSSAVDIIVIDSVAALVPKAEIEGEMGDSFMGLQARLMSQALRKLTGALQKSNTTLIFINQIREKIGVMFGSPETTTGGRALKYYASVRIDVRRIGTVKDGTEMVGARIKAKVAKNKVAPPFRLAEFDIMFGVGISTSGDLIDLGVKYNIVDKAGAWFSYGETRLGQGREASKRFIEENPEVADEILAKLKAELKPEPSEDDSTPTEEADD